MTPSSVATTGAVQGQARVIANANAKGPRV
jgi:hypothetical protein